MSHTKLQEVAELARKAFSESTNRQELYDQKVKYLGKKGELTALMKEMGKLPKEERPAFGQMVNEVKSKLEEQYAQYENQLGEKELEAKIQSEKLDLTLPAPEVKVGSRHPVSLVIDQMQEVMGRLGYSVRTGPLIESDRNNFEALNIPADHPARDMQDTFFIDDHNVLRTHTSPIQIRTLESEELPLRIIGVGAVFRVDNDISHLPHFHQVEGMCVDKKVSMADLKGTISFFVRDFFGASLKTRFRPSFFPFTEPSAEVDCQCPLCKGKGCSLCGQSGWVEIGGCGLVNPKVFEHAGIDSKEWKGFAFGFGVERMAIIKYGINDIRLLPENDTRFLEQFRR